MNQNEVTADGFRDEGGEIQISLGDLFRVFVKSLLPMILAAVICGGGLFLYRFLTYTPVYTSTATLYVLPIEGDEQATSSDFAEGVYIASDSASILVSRDLLTAVGLTVKQTVETDYAGKYTFDDSYSSLRHSINVSVTENGRVLEVTAQAEHPVVAKILVDELCLQGAARVRTLVGSDAVKVLDQGNLPAQASNSVFTLSIIAVAFLAAVVVYGVCCIIYFVREKMPHTASSRTGTDHTAPGEAREPD